MWAGEFWHAPVLAVAGAALLAFGGVVLVALQTRPTLAPTIRGVWAEYRVLAGMFAAVVATVLWAEVLALPVLMAVGGRIGWELGRTLAPGRQGIVWTATAATAGLAVLPLPLLPLAALWAGGVALRLVAHGWRVPLWADALLFPVLPFGVLTAAFDAPEQAPVLLAALILSETFDSYALLAGRIAGRTPLAPRLSPKKTWEGAVGGAAMLIATAALAAVFARDIDIGVAALTAALAGGASLCGDLAASRLKRQAGVKDFPRLLPPQGGLLDVLDAWIATAAALAVAAALL
jgi:phosphatidate cytidylyltransferase